MKRIRLKNGARVEKFVKSREEAFIASRLGNNWISIDSFLLTITPFIPEEKVKRSLIALKEYGILEISKEKRRLKYQTKRNFENYTFGSEIDEKNDLPKDLKKEILFLYNNLKKLNYYKLLNITNPLKSTVEDIRNKIEYYRNIFNPVRYMDYNLGTYEQKMRQVFFAINKASVIANPEIKKKYDKRILASLKIKEAEKKIEKNLNTNPKIKAAKKYAKALYYASKNELENAVEEIEIATIEDPANQNYKILKEKWEKLLANRKIEELYSKLEKDDFILFDENKLAAVIDDILDLSGNSPEANLRIAKIMEKKQLYTLAIEHSNLAKKKTTNKEILAEVRTIINLSTKQNQKK